MSWIFYIALNFIKLIIIFSLVLLSVITLPVIVLLLLLGMSLSYIRDLEPKVYSEKYRSLIPLDLLVNNIKAVRIFLFPMLTTRFQQILITRNKSNG